MKIGYANWLGLFLLGAGLQEEAAAQVDSSSKSNFTFSGYAEFYYSGQLSGERVNAKPSYVYSHNRLHELALNLALLKANYQADRLRANIGLGFGSYMQANYAAEPSVLRHLYEANVGLRLTQKADLWLDVGVLPSHIGFESAVGADNATLTRSILADNSPFFETGARLGYTTANQEWYMSLLLLNGWQHIQQNQGNTRPAFGHQLTWKPTANLTLNSSSFIGNDKPDSLAQQRYFHNFYAQIKLSPKWQATAAFDIGAEQQAKDSKKYNYWYSPIVVLRYQPLEKLSLTGRAEYYEDRNNVIIALEEGDKFATWAYSLNADYNILPNVNWRVEFRKWQVQDAPQLSMALTASF